MIQITIPAPTTEDWDEVNEEFIYHTVGKDITICLEHSLVSISKWESKWCKSFLSSVGSSNIDEEEFLDYIKCMTLTKNVPDDIYTRLTIENIDKIYKYINAPMTATKFGKDIEKTSSKKIITSERIYSWMISLSIPFECQKWHINRLLTLIRVCELQNSPPKKYSKQEIMKRNAALNAARRNKLNSKG